MLENLSFADLLIIGSYFGLVLWIAWWVSKGRANSKKDRGSVDYFLAGKDQGWFVIGASLFASNIGSEIILGVSDGYSIGTTIRKPDHKTCKVYWLWPIKLTKIWEAFNASLSCTVPTIPGN